LGVAQEEDLPTIHPIIPIIWLLQYLPCYWPIKVLSEAQQIELAAAVEFSEMITQCGHGRMGYIDFDYCDELDDQTAKKGEEGEAVDVGGESL
jgi:hypothetical protein